MILDRIKGWTARRIWMLAIFIVFALIGITLLVNTLIVHFFECNLAALGQVGDMFGSLNALLNFITIGILIYTIVNQREEIKSQKTELQFQRFENTFFQLLQLHNQNLYSMEYHFFDGKNQILRKGRDVFSAYYLTLRDHYKKWTAEQVIKSKQLGLNSPDVNNNNIPIDETLRLYNKVYNSFESDLGHYFITLYQIFKFVDEAKIEIVDKEKYAKIVRAQLSRYELVFLFYNGLSENGKQFKDRYIDKYQVLKNISKRSIFSDEHLKEYSHLDKQ